MPRIKKVRSSEGQHILSGATKYQKREYGKSRAKKKSLASKFLRG